MVLLVELLDLACELQLHRRKDHREHTRRDHEGLLGLKVGWVPSFRTGRPAIRFAFCTLSPKQQKHRKLVDVIFRRSVVPASIKSSRHHLQSSNRAFIGKAAVKVIGMGHQHRWHGNEHQPHQQQQQANIDPEHRHQMDHKDPLLQLLAGKVIFIFITAASAAS